MFARILLLCALALVGLVLPRAAAAQAQTFVNGTDGPLSETASPCTASGALVRDITVGASFTVGDVDLGLRGTHNYRGVLLVALQSPDGTLIVLVNGDANINGDNFNYRLDDAATQTVNTDGDAVNHQTGAVNGGFEHRFRPESPLSAFNGKNSQGTWRMYVCHRFNGGVSGTFRHSELYLTPQTSPFADLSLTKTVSTAAPAPNQQITYTLTVQKRGELHSETPRRRSPMSCPRASATSPIPGRDRSIRRRGCGRRACWRSARAGS